METRSDADLVDEVRRGQVAAYAALFVRHRDAACRVARRHGDTGEADDVVAESFARVLARIRAGGGPDVSFRAYLLTTVRHEVRRRTALARRCRPTEDVELLAGSVRQPDVDDGLRVAYSSLPERWRIVLWRLDVEGVPPRELAVELGVSANAVSALGCRARAGLRAAYRRGTAAA